MDEFEGDLHGAVFWGADLREATFRDVDLAGVRISHAHVVDVEIDAHVDRLVVNGVDVTDYVNAHDPWQPLRGMLRPADVAGMRATWAALDEAWATTIGEARALPGEQLWQSVGGEWSFVQTLRHLVFAIDKWFTVPLAGGSFHPIGMPNTGSIDFGWPGLDAAAEPSFDEVLAVRAERWQRFGGYLETLTDDELQRQVDVLENGTVPLAECVYTVFEEEFEHRRYAIRDLAALV